MKIVIIDDQLLVAKSFAGVLEAKGYRTECFQTGKEFFATDSVESAACLMVDLHLPGMNGCEIIQRLRESGCEIPAIIISGDFSSELIETISQYDKIIKLQKPCSVAEIYEAIESLIERTD